MENERQINIAETPNSLKKDIYPVGDLIRHAFWPEEWVVKQLIPQKSITAITGAPASFKSWITLEMAKSITRGTKFLDYYDVTQGTVLIVDKENHPRHVKERVKMLGLDQEKIYYFLQSDDFFINRPKDFETILNRIEQVKADVVIFDSLVRIHSGDENEAQHIAKVMNAFKKITYKGPSVIFIHHNRKESGNAHSGNSIRGSSDILAGIDCALQVIKVDKNTLKVKQTKLRQGEAIEALMIEIHVDKEKNLMEFKHGGINSQDKTENKIKDDILIFLGKEVGRSRHEIVEAFSKEYKVVNLDQAFKELEAEGKIIKHVHPHNKYSYSLKVQQELALENAPKIEQEGAKTPLSEGISI